MFVSVEILFHVVLITSSLVKSTGSRERLARILAFPEILNLSSRHYKPTYLTQSLINCSETVDMPWTGFFASQQLYPHLNPSHGSRCTQINLVRLESSGAGIKNNST